jgi:transcription elongation GreA/GreB family factor
MPVDNSGRVASEHATRVSAVPVKNRHAVIYRIFPVNKPAVRDAILQQLRAELATQARAAAMARDEAISEESRPENKWDTHSQEAAYLAESQAKLAAEIGASIELLANMPLPPFASGDPAALGALVTVEAGPGARIRTLRYFLAPRAGGVEVAVDGTPVLVLTPQSPLGRQLLGKRVGDTLAAPGRGPGAVQRIVAVA